MEFLKNIKIIDIEKEHKQIGGIINIDIVPKSGDLICINNVFYIVDHAIYNFDSSSADINVISLNTFDLLRNKAINVQRK